MSISYEQILKAEKKAEEDVIEIKQKYLLKNGWSVGCFGELCLWANEKLHIAGASIDDAALIQRSYDKYRDL